MKLLRFKFSVVLILGFCSVQERTNSIYANTQGVGLDRGILMQQSRFNDYLKKATKKSGQHSMRNIDFIYTINLDQRPEKFELCTRQLSPYGIQPFRFSAVNGWELSLDVVNDLGIKYQPWMLKGLWGTYYPLKKETNIIASNQATHEVMHENGRNYFCHCMAPGTIGILLSHLSVLKDAYDSGYQTIWVMEDDIQVIKDPRTISTLIDKLDTHVGRKGWDILFTDRDTKDQKGNYVPCMSYAPRPNFSPNNPERFAQRKNVGTCFMRIGARYGAYSMIVRRSGMKKLLNFFARYSLFLPYDMDMCVPNGIRLYSTIDDVVSTLPQALSDNGAPGYQNKKNHK